MTQLREETLLIPGAPLGPENPLPYFRDPRNSRDVTALPDLPAAKRAYLGWETALRVLPYRMQDSYARQRQTLAFRAVVLENEFLRATFLPEMGGRLISLVYLPLERELLHRNPVFQPADLAIRNAWFSGGIEWNVGQYGHAFTTCSPIFAAEIAGPDGSPGLRLWEYERCKGLFWQIDFALPPGQPFLSAHVRVTNPSDAETSMYYWTNIAVDERPGVRVLAASPNAVYAHPGGGFGYGALPDLPTLPGKDATYPLNWPFASEFFFQCESTAMPWEAALDAQGAGLVDASTPRLAYRKLFCWGTHRGGRRWQEFLAQPGEAYCEVQAGLAPTQVHGLPMPPRATWDWTQVFGFLQADPARVHDPHYPAAQAAVEAALAEWISPERLLAVESQARALADRAPGRILQAGAGWGALELLRRSRERGVESLPSAVHFPPGTLTPAQEPWRKLLQEGELPERDPAQEPGEWMVQAEWMNLLAESRAAGLSHNWYALLHLGVMRLESGDESGAESAWTESLALRPSVWALRNLAALSLRREDLPAALDCYTRAWQLGRQQGTLPAALAVETLQAFLLAGRVADGLQFYAALPSEVMWTDRVQVLLGRLALAAGDLDTVERVLERDYAVMREGEASLVDLWIELHARRLAQSTGRPLDDDLRAQAARDFPPPQKIDFRSAD